MIRQQFSISGYWEVIVFYNLDYDLFGYIADDLYGAGISDTLLKELYGMMHSGKAKAVTYSHTQNHISIILFNPHDNKEDYLNSIVHEAEHVKQAILYAYYVKDEGEPPAYTIGYLVMKMWKVFRDLLCGKCN